MIFNDSKVAVIGGDSRMLYAANAFSARGAECAVFANGAPISDPCDFTKAYSLEGALEGAELVILPIPLSRDGHTLNAPFCRSGISLADIAKKSSRTSHIFAGAVRGAFDKSAHCVTDYSESEFFASRNGALTAEGALSIAIDNSNISILGSSCSVLGFGRIGRALASRLSALGAQVTVFARDPKDRAFIEHLGLRAYDYKRAGSELADTDFLFNTVPDKAVASLTGHVSASAHFIVLAGQLAGEGRIINVACLPSVYSPKSAGILIADTVERLYGEMREGGGL